MADCAIRGRGGGGRRFIARRLAPILTILPMLILAGPRLAGAASAQVQAARLSDSAFALLNSINGGSAKAGAALGPVASLAGDAQTMASALERGDRATAARAMAAVVKDRAAIDAAAKDSPALNTDQWDGIKNQIATLEKTLPPSAAPAEAAAEPPPAAAPAEEGSSSPKAEITSRVFRDGAVRVRGFVAGTDLKSAGVYDGDEMIRDLQVSPSVGGQRVNFDVTVDSPNPAESIRVTDAYGHEARALIAPDSESVGAIGGGAETVEVEPGASAAEEPIAEPPKPRTNVAEIARSEDAAAPSRRGLASSPLAPLVGVQIDVIYTGEPATMPGNLEIIGQISGPGVKRAGVYAGGRLIRPIAVASAGFSSFDVTFPMPPLTVTTTIRAYGAGVNYVEAPVDANEDNSFADFPSSPPYGQYPVYPPPYGVPNPYGYGMNPYAYGNPYGYGMNPYANPYYRPGMPPPGYGASPPPAAAAPPSWWGR